MKATNLDGASQVFLADVERIQRGIGEASRQVSSGKRVARASHAPDQVEPILQLRAESQRRLQAQSNLALASTDTAAADGALAQAIKLMDRARVLAAQGVNATLDASGRQSISDEVASLLEQMVALSRTTSQGRYIFGGDLDGTPPYSFDPSVPDGVVQMSDAEATRHIENPAGGSFRAALSAGEVFDTRNEDGSQAEDNVFAALNSLRVALAENDDSSIEDSVSSLRTASTRLNTSQSFYGNVEKLIGNAESYVSQTKTRLQTELSEREDADVVAAALALTQANTQLQAAFQMRAQMPKSSLFDYLG